MLNQFETEEIMFGSCAMVKVRQKIILSFFVQSSCAVRAMGIIWSLGTKTVRAFYVVAKINYFLCIDGVMLFENVLALCKNVFYGFLLSRNSKYYLHTSQ